MAKKAEVLTEAIIKERLELGNAKMSKAEYMAYTKMKDDLGDAAQFKDTEIPKGFKRCGKCGHIKKFYMFNRNKEVKTGCTGTCKECQKEAARQSYKKTKKRRNYRKYYAEHKEEKRENARKYYEENKDGILAKQRDYHDTKQGKKVMHKSHAKRREAIRKNSGISYTRQLVIDRDSLFIGKKNPICNICGKPITNTDGEHMHLDHVIPIVIGGKDCFTNVACVHADCNLRKEKDARETSNLEIERIVARAEDYMLEHPEKFEE